MPGTINGKDLLTATITEPKVGCWTAVIDADSDVAISGAVTIIIDGVTWSGTVIKGDVHAGRAHAQVIAGAGKLATVLDAKYYLGIPLLVVLTDLMLGTGETLASTTDAAVRNHTVARWARPQGKASAGLRQIADELAVTWRALRDGTVWLGVETWPTVAPEYDEIDRVPGRDSVTIAPTTPAVLPGCVFDGRHVSRVTTRFESSGLRQEILYEAESGGSRVSEDMAALIEYHVGNRIDYSRLYPSKVLKQAGDGTLELLPDAAKLRGTGLTRVPIRHGIPGVNVKVPSGGKVLLFFEAGDPKLPAAALWPDGSSVTQISIKAPTVIIDGDLQVTGEVTARSATPATSVTLSGHLHPTSMGPSSKPTPGT